MQYYLKKCRFQELGSVGADGVPHRGRYLFTPMDDRILSFFPPLSVAQINDSALLPIVLLSTGKKVYCTYVYHNDKFHNSTAAHPRNEYRIYLNRSLEGNGLLFEVNDIVIMRKEEMISEDEDIQTVYLMDIIKNHESEEYIRLNEIIDRYPIRGGYGILEGVIDEFEKRASKLSGISTAPAIIDEMVMNCVIANPEESLAKIFNSSAFRDFVLAGYGYKCAVTGKDISYGNYTNVEAAHIKPKSHGGLNLPNNGLALGRDLHWAFDKGFFTLNDEYKVVVHPEITSEYLRSFDGVRIRLPENQFFVPTLDNIHYHNENVYGLFLRTGRL